jgi:S1-C subfamily serine protease
MPHPSLLRLFGGSVLFSFATLLSHAADITAAASPPAAEPAKPAASAVENAVVKVFATLRYPDPFKPWSKQAPQEITGSGVVIEGKRILTNAHVALYASQIQVQANQSGDKLSATLEFIAPGIDLAILKLEDESFFDTHPPLLRAKKLPNVKDSVMVYGFPTGGTSLSITKGIVSRIDFVSYNFPTSGLRIQIDAAINPGNSGGPALAGEEMIGLAFSKLGGADNIGYIIPNEEVDLFLQDIADGRYDGKPAMYDSLQTFENPALHPWLKLPKTVEGLIVQQPDTNDPLYPLKPWDVITHISGTPIDNEGMVKVDENIRVNFQYLIQKKTRQGKVPLTIVRAGQEKSIELPVSPVRPMLITDLMGDYPTYFIYGPLVFSPATAQYLGPISGNARAMSTLSVLGSPLVTRRGDKPAFPDEQLVVVSSPFFPHRLSKGYNNPSSRVVAKVNNTVIKNLAHLVTLLREATDEYIVIEFAGLGGESLVFPRKEMVAATEEILNDNGVRAQGTPDEMKIWNAKK